jgi:hypothetical protein
MLPNVALVIILILVDTPPVNIESSAFTVMVRASAWARASDHKDEELREILTAR